MSTNEDDPIKQFPPRLQHGSTIQTYSKFIASVELHCSNHTQNGRLINYDLVVFKNEPAILFKSLRAKFMAFVTIHDFIGRPFIKLTIVNKSSKAAIADYSANDHTVVEIIDTTVCSVKLAADVVKLITKDELPSYPNNRV